MSPSERELWMERIARALAELKKGLPPADGGPSGEARDEARDSSQDEATREK
jgi:hypothetical protein